MLVLLACGIVLVDATLMNGVYQALFQVLLDGILVVFVSYALLA